MLNVYVFRKAGAPGRGLARVTRQCGLFHNLQCEMKGSGTLCDSVVAILSFPTGTSTSCEYKIHCFLSENYSESNNLSCWLGFSYSLVASLPG